MVCFDLIGWMAAALTLSAYTMRTMIPLRLTAIAASLFFVAYGALMQIYPMLVLHMLLLPFNSHRLFEIFRTARKIHVARARRADGGEYLSRKGDPLDSLCILDAGRIDPVEIDGQVEQGEMFGELAFFSNDGLRTLSARCHGKCELPVLSEDDFLKLFYQNPAFAFSVVKLVANRLAQSRPTVEGARGTPG
jgi:hypothetical protein